MTPIRSWCGFYECASILRVGRFNPPVSSHFRCSKLDSLNFDSFDELIGLHHDTKRRGSPRDTSNPRSWFGPNGQYIRELPCPSCRGRGYTSCAECGIERSRSDCSQCRGKGITTCNQCHGDCVIWEESIDEQPWEKARSTSPLKVNEDDEVDYMEINLDTKKPSKRVYKSLRPEVGVKISQSLKILNAKTGLFSKRMIMIHQDPKLGAQRAAAIRKAKGTPEARKLASEATKAYFSNPENRVKQSIAMKGVKFYCGKCGGEGHRRHYCPQGKRMQYKCRLCGKRGHNRRKCVKAVRSEDQNNGNVDKENVAERENYVRKKHHCKICKKGGHNSRTCEEGSLRMETKLNSSQRSGYACKLCGVTGHNSRTCNSRNEN